MGTSSSRLDFDHTKYDDKICHTHEEIIVQKLRYNRTSMYKLVKSFKYCEPSLIIADDECDFCCGQLKHMHNNYSVIFSSRKNNEIVCKYNIECDKYFIRSLIFFRYIKTHRFIFLGMQDENSIFSLLPKDIGVYFRQLLIKLSQKFE